MYAKHHIAFTLVALFNLHTYGELKPEQSATLQQPDTQINHEATYGTVVDFEELIKKHGSEEEALKKIVNTDKVVVDFYAAWCPPCKSLAPNFVSAAENFPSILCVKIDAQQFSAISKKYNVRSFPTLIFFQKGTKIGSISGFRNQKELIKEISNVFNVNPR